MSVRAYKIITKEVAHEPSFNLWRDSDLLEMMLKFDNDSQEKDSLISLSVRAIKHALKNYKWEENGDYRKEQLTEDIKGLADDEFVEYECY